MFSEAMVTIPLSSKEALQEVVPKEEVPFTFSLPSISGFRLAAVRSILRPTGSMTLLLSVAVVTTLVAAEESHPLLTAVLVDVVTIPVVAGSSPLLPTIVPADAWDLVAVA
jgi:hypothetical protein